MKQLVELAGCKRGVEFYLRALWNKDFNLESLEASETIPYGDFLSSKLVLPASISSDHYTLDYYHAVSTHISAHFIFGNEPYDASDLNLMQTCMIDLIEDLRVEILAINTYPGLRKCWLNFHTKNDESETSAKSLMRRLSRSVLDQDYQDSSLWVQKGEKLFFDNILKLQQLNFSREIGLRLANDLGQMRLPLNSGRQEQLIAYRDDNRHLWFEHIEHEQEVESIKQAEQASLDNKKLQETDNGKRVNIVDGDFVQGEGMHINQQDAAVLEFRNNRMTDSTSPIYYPEWDYRSNVLKKDWCKLNVQQVKAGEMNQLENILSTHKFILHRLRSLAKKLQVEKRQRVRKIQEGDDIDYGPMIDAMVSVRMNTTPDARVFMRNEYRQTKSLAISILLDLSESTNYVIGGVSITQRIRDAVLLLGETLTVADEQFSISGFSSNTRHEINYINFKSFSERFTNTKGRLLDIRGKYSTRLGAAIRHTAEYLKQQNASKKLLLVITDGAPSDIDVFDSKYLEHDSWQAVSRLQSKGIKPFCLNLDSRSDEAIEHIFGKGRFETIDHINKLPEVLSRIYVRYGRH